MSTRKCSVPRPQAQSSARSEAKLISKPSKPLVIQFGSPVEQARFMFASGTSERPHADLILYGTLNAAGDASRGNPPSERDIN
jgi:hypothetical protein